MIALNIRGGDASSESEGGFRNPLEHPRANLGAAERLVTAVLGGALTGGGLYSLIRNGSMLGAFSAAVGGVLLYRGASGYCPVYNALGVGDADATPTSHPLNRDITVEHTITIHKPTGEVYRFWRDLRNLPHVLRHIRQVEVLDERRSRWTANGPADKPVTWEAEITEDRVDQMIAWASRPGSEVENSGSVRFQNATGGRGTVVSVKLHYRPPAGVLGALIARLLGRAPGQQLEEDLRNFKQMLETGEVATNAGPSARKRSVDEFHPSRTAAALSGGTTPTKVENVGGTAAAKVDNVNAGDTAPTKVDNVGGPSGGARPTETERDRVQQASTDSFPASDPPGWTSGPSGE